MLNFDFHKLYSYKYLFQIDRVQLAHTDWWFLYIGIGLVGLAIILRVLQIWLKNPFDKAFFNKIFKIALIAGLCESLWFAARYETVMFFGTHFVALLILLVAFVWEAVVKIKFLKNRSKQTSAWQKEQLKQKYLQKS